MGTRESDIAYTLHTERPIAPDALRVLYEQEAWWPERSDDALVEVLNTGAAIGAWTEDQLIGFARVVSDGQFRAYVEDVIVHREYRGQGVGTVLMKRLLAHLDDLDLISLFCAPSLVPFYEECGLHPTHQVVLHWRHPRQK